MPLTAGTRLGLCEVLAPLGAGGVGEVYRARDTKLGREVAIKALPEAFSRDAQARAVPTRSERRWQVSRNGGADPVWSSRGDEISFRSGRRLMAASFQENPLRIGGAELLFDGNYGEHFDVAPDGQRFLMVELENNPEQKRIRIIQNWLEELEQLVPAAR